MKHLYIADIPDYVGQSVTLHGWVYSIRSVGKVWFLIFRDGTGLLQCVVVKSVVVPEIFELGSRLTQESSVSVTGSVNRDERALGGYELQLSNLEVHQLTENYPITLKEHGTAFLMDHRHLWLRSKLQHAIMRVRHQVIKSSRDFLDDHGFILVDTPILTANACEGTTSLFNVDYFDQTAYLSQSGQLYSEATIMAHGKVYCFGPTFRAEKSKTRRHLTEFWMVEPEMAYCDLDENMEWAENFISHVVSWCLEHCREELAILQRDTARLESVTPPFPRITYDEAVKILQEQGVDFQYGSDFGGGDETILSAQYDRPVMVHRWPADVKAFYMKRDPRNDDLALGMDVLAPEGYGEIVGGGQREDDYDILLKRIQYHDLPLKPLQWYLDLRRYGSVPHSGFGMGIERVVAWITGIQHIRETIPFPRTIYRLEP